MEESEAQSEVKLGCFSGPERAEKTGLGPKAGEMISVVCDIF